MSEKFCLKWNDFDSNVSKSFGLLRNEEYLHDVTLVCDDNSMVSAHKLVLSACSEFFKAVFKNNKHQNPLICLEGISARELQDILDYMYNGKANIYQEGLEKFLLIAQRFKIMGLLQNEEFKPESDEKNDFTSHQEYTLGLGAGVTDTVRTNTEKNNPTNDYDKTKMPVQSNTAISLNVGDVSNITKQADELIETLSDGSLKCTHCGKLASKGNLNIRQNMRTHTETHLEGITFDCQLCGSTLKSRTSLRFHLSRQHRSH